MLNSIDIFASIRQQAAQINAAAPTVAPEPIIGLTAFGSLTAADAVHMALALPALPHQNVVINAVAAGHKRFILADEMGVGKTASALGAMEIANAYPCLVIVPPSLTTNWERECARFLPHKTTAVMGGTKVTTVPVADIVICPDSIIASWALVKASNGRWIPGVLANAAWGGLVVDEAHRMKGLAEPKPAKRARAAEMIASRLAPEALSIAMSGTPILNRPKELVGSLTIARVLNQITRTKGEFLFRYCGPESNGFGTTFNGASNISELSAKLKSVMIRRLKSEVLSLPEKVRVTTKATISDAAQRLINQAEADLQSFLRRETGDKDYGLNERAHAIVLLTTLRRLTGVGKVEASIEHIRSLVSKGEKVVVFAHHTEVIGRISEALRTSGTQVVEIIGSMNTRDRMASVDALQSGKAQVLVGNMLAAGVGFTLTEACHTVTVELPWCPGILQQAEDRCHRIGQTRPVTSHILLAGDGSVDDRVWGLLNDKARTIGMVLDDDDAALVDDDLLSSLLNSYR